VARRGFWEGGPHVDPGGTHALYLSMHELGRSVRFALWVPSHPVSAQREAADATVLALALWSFRVALAGRPLLRDELLKNSAG
jgi:hypothetical protein